MYISEHAQTAKKDYKNIGKNDKLDKGSEKYSLWDSDKHSITFCNMIIIPKWDAITKSMLSALIARF